jgi:hypothetical protein
MKSRWYCILVGGLAFWLPAIVLDAFHEGEALLWRNFTPLLGLTALALIDWIGLKRVLRWNWVLAGIYILGPISILTSAMCSGGTPFWKLGWGGVLAELVFCLFPPATLLLSLYDFTICAVLAASAVLPLLALIPRSKSQPA